MEENIDTSYSCDNHRFCNLLHIFNNCSSNFQEMTERNNGVQTRIVEAIIKHRGIKAAKISINKIIDFSNFEELNQVTLKNEVRQGTGIHY